MSYFGRNVPNLAMVARCDRAPAVVHNSCAYPFEAGRAVCKTEELPSFGNAKNIEAATNDTVVPGSDPEE